MEVKVIVLEAMAVRVMVIKVTVKKVAVKKVVDHIVVVNIAAESNLTAQEDVAVKATALVLMELVLILKRGILQNLAVAVH